MRLIDADVLWDVFREKQNSLTARCGGYRFLDSEDRAKYDRLEITLAYIENAPEVDAVPVVRCGACRWFADNNGGNWFGCQMFNAVRLVPEDAPKENDYCSYGEKMESEGST